MEALANYYISVIQENKNLLIQDILIDVIDELRQFNVITDEEFNKIMGKEYVPIQEFHCVVDRLLELLMAKSHSDVIKFVRSLKPNYNWLYKLFDDDQINECLLSGGVPALPKILAERKELLSRVRESLTLLKRGNYVVLYGMPGCGKTTLAAHCLHDASLLQHFNNTVLWVSTNHDDIPSIQTNMNILLKEKIQLTGDTNSDRSRIKNGLSGNECLVVLDDVQSASVIEAMNIACKILVTATDRTVMKNFESVTEFIDVNSSFNLEETLNLFAQAIGSNEDPSKLPFNATIIHSYARGFPLTVSLLVGILEDNKESALENDSPIWKTLIKLLENKQYALKMNSSHGNENLGKTQRNHVISHAIENLGEDVKVFFNYFALFVEDINIKQEVLCTVWNLDEISVQEILLHFVKKSLIVRKWVEKSYVYGIHDIILSCLKENLSPKHIKKLHVELIGRYVAKCPEGDLSKLPRNDNYIFYYIGHHLKAACLIDRLTDLYTNLEFIEAKLQVTGPADLLTDYNKYLHDIQDPSLLEKIREISKFVEVCGRDLNLLWKKNGKKSSDIVQFILQETRPHSFLYKSAMDLVAKRRQHTPYIYFPIGPFSKGNEPAEILHQSACVTSMKTTLLNDVIIIGYENGSIVMYNTKIKSVIYKYSGHEGFPIKGLAMNKDNTFFLSYSLDKRISIWRLFDSPQAGLDIFHFDDGRDEPRTPSPVTVQENHSPMFQSKAITSFTNLHHHDVIVCAVYAMHHPTLIAASSAQSLIVWKDSKIKWLKTVQNVHSCLFCKNDSLVLAGSKKIVGFSADNGSIIFETTLPVNMSVQSSVISLLMNPEEPDDVLVTTHDVLGLWTFSNRETQCKVFHPVNQFRHHYRYYQFADIGKYIAVAYADSEIEIFEKNSASSLGMFHNQKGEIKCICLSYDKLYAAYSDNTICVWPMKELNNCLEPLPTDPVTIRWVDNVPCIASFSKNNSILVKTERKLISEIPDVHDLHMVQLSEDCKFVAYCHENHLLSRCFIEPALQPFTYRFNSRPTVLNVYKHHDRHMILAAAKEGQLLVWCENKMTFRAQANTKIQNAYYLSGSIICTLTNGAVEEYKVDDPSYYRCIEQGDAKCLAYLSATSSKNQLAVILYLSVTSSYTLTVYTPFEVAFTQQLPSECYSVAFSPDGSYLAVLLWETKSIWMWKGLKSKVTKEVSKDVVVKGTLAVSNDGTLCLRTKGSIFLLTESADSWSEATMTSETPLVSTSPSHRHLFATVDSCSILHTLSPTPLQNTNNKS